MDGDIRILAIVYCDTGYDTSNIVWSIHNEMILETIFGIFLTIAGGGDKSVDPASVVIKGIQTGKKIVEKKEKDELNASVHEEVYQMTKDYIYQIRKELK